MESSKEEHIFDEAFELFKVFETLPFEIYGKQIKNYSKTIWQILNHLVTRQEYQIRQLKDEENLLFDESDLWILQQEPEGHQELEIKIQDFIKQIDFIKLTSKDVSLSDSNQLKILVELSTHLSFHIGEIILLARLEGKYPQADEMMEFLKDA